MIATELIVTKLEELTSPIGLIAGNGCFPRDLILQAHELGLKVVLVGHEGETLPEIAELADYSYWVKLGQLTKIINYFKKHQVRHVAMAGGIRRVKIFGGVRPDLRAIGLIARLGGLREDALLRGIAAELEKDGLSLFSPTLILKNSIPGSGVLTRRSPTEEEIVDAQMGWEVAKTIGKVDVGQSVVVYKTLIIAVEAIEGTDAMILRAGGLTQKKGGVLIKVAKPTQDLRMDLPAVGEKTIQLMRESGITCLVLESGKAVMLNPIEFIKQANSAGIAVIAVSGPEEIINK